MDTSTPPLTSANPHESNSLNRQQNSSPEGNDPDAGQAPEPLVEGAGAATDSDPGKLASYIGHKAEEAVAFAGRQAEYAASFIGKKSDQASAAAGDSLRSLGGSVRENRPSSKIAGDATSALADSLDKGGRYLQEEGIKEIADDITNLIRRNPIPALLIGVAAGFLLGKAMKPRS